MSKDKGNDSDYNPEDLQEDEEKENLLKKEDKIVMMEKGDYNVHILVEEVKNLIEIRPDTLPKPRIKMTVFGNSKYTKKVKTGCQDYFYNEHFYFDKSDLTPEMLDSEKIVIEVYDNSHTKRIDYYGIYELDFQYIYKTEKHALQNVWIALANPESNDISKIRGYLKLSISVLHEKDERIELKTIDNEIKDCIIPSQIQTKYKQIYFYFFRGEQFPDMDAITVLDERKVNRRCDGYIEVSYMGITRVTSVVTMVKEIVDWNEIVNIPATDPATSQKIVIVVKDKDTLKKSDIVGSIELKIDDIFAGKYNELQYLDIYGSSINSDKDISHQMNYNSEIGSRWNGRLLMKCVVKEGYSQGQSVEKIRDINLINKAINTPRKIKWTIWVRIISALYLPEETSRYGIRVCCQEQSKYIPCKTAVNSCINFSETFKLNINTFKDKEGDKLPELPDLFIYLTDYFKFNVCFQRLKLKPFYLNKNMYIIKLLPDPCINKVKTIRKSGIIQCRIFLYNTDKDKDIPTEKEFNEGGIASIPVEDDDDDDLENMLKEDNKPKKVLVEKKKYTVIATVFMSKGIISGDKSGTSDLFVKLKSFSTKKETQTKNDTMNGIWNENLEFNDVEMEIDDFSTWPIFFATIFDRNQLIKLKLKGNVPLGYNYILLCNSAYTLNDIDLRTPKWHKFLLPNSNKEQGQILLSFHIFDKAHENLKYKLNQATKLTLYSFQINILGLRKLKPLGIIGVKKPFIKFNISSLNVTGDKSKAFKNIQTLPVNGGANPTMNSYISFELELPENLVFMPELQCEVYDNMLNGLHNSSLGVFSFDLKKLIKKTHREIEEELNKKDDKEEEDNIISTSTIPKNKIYEEEKIDDDNIISTSTQKKKEINNINNIDNKIENKIEKEKEEEEYKNSDSSSDENSEEKKLKDNEEEDFYTKEEKEKDNGHVEMTDITNIIDKKEDDPNLPKNFILLPKLRHYKIPGYGIKEQGQVQGQDQIQIQEEEEGQEEKLGENELKRKLQKDFLVEDEGNIPDIKYYYPVGYLLKMEKVRTFSESTKHYRRIFRKPLEKEDKVFKLENPFIIRRIRRGEYKDKRKDTFLFDFLVDEDSKKLFEYDDKVPIIIDEKSSYYSQGSQMTLFDAGKKIHEKHYGKFKGLVRIAEKKKLLEYEAEMKRRKEEKEKKIKEEKEKIKKEKEEREKDGIVEKEKEKEEKKEVEEEIVYLDKYEELKMKLLNRKKIIIRVYILELKQLAEKDRYSASDPYIKILLNDKEVINERKNHLDDKVECQWCKYYDIAGEMPGSSNLKIDVWDWNEVLSDELIGSTEIDLEDRYFNETWKKMENKPIEVRNLYHPDIYGPQGQVYMWMEIFEVGKNPTPEPWKIMPEPLNEYEIRLVVWETEDMPMMDAEGTSDIYVKAYIQQKELQKTDIHFRCQTGCASFNWRIVLPLRLPEQNPKIYLQVYDKDIFSSDDYMCGAIIDLKEIIKIPKLLDVPISLTRKFYNGLTEKEKKPLGVIKFLSRTEDAEGSKFWVTCYKGLKDATGEGVKSGKVLCSLDILPKRFALSNKVGKGRSEPNINPYLPPPVGRFQFTLNPFKLINQLVGPKFRRKCYTYCICCLIIFLFLFGGPSLITSIIF